LNHTIFYDDISLDTYCTNRFGQNNSKLPTIRLNIEMPFADSLEPNRRKLNIQNTIALKNWPNNATYRAKCQTGYEETAC